LALAVPLSRFTPQIGGGSAFFVRLRDMSLPKTALIAGGLAFLTTNFCILCIMSGGVFLGPVAYIGDYLMYPALHFWILFAPKIESALLNDVFLYLVGFFQFFILFCIMIWLRYGRRAA
jgi:hypothetical protein